MIITECYGAVETSNLNSGNRGLGANSAHGPAPYW
jgi:hypothetical protein